MLAAASYGRIVLYSFGGLAVGSNRLSVRLQRILVSFAGPLAGFVFLAIVVGVEELRYPGMARAYLAYIGMTFGMNAGYAINPARDFGPRLFTAIACWGGEVFRAGNGWWWVPLVATPVGALVGGFFYDVCITRLRPAEPVAPIA